MGARDIFVFVSRIDFIISISEFAFRSTIYIIWATKLAHADDPLKSFPPLEGAKYIGECVKVVISCTVASVAPKEVLLNASMIYVLF